MKFIAAAVVVFLSLPLVSEAALVKPQSPEGQLLVHRMAKEATRAFVEQTEALQNDDAHEKVRVSCEASKSILLADLEALEVKSASELLDAKQALEKVTCPSESVEAAPAGELRRVHDKFFSATVSLRSLDSLN